LASTEPILLSIARTFATTPAATRAWRWALGLLVVAVGYLALTPHPPEGIDTGWDKLNHVLAFMALAFCAGLSAPASLSARRLSMCGLLAYGALIEVLQLYVPGRSSEWGDLLADAIGIALGAAIAASVLQFSRAPPPDSG
jgi:VanZ family protein